MAIKKKQKKKKRKSLAEKNEQRWTRQIDKIVKFCKKSYGFSVKFKHVKDGKSFISLGEVLPPFDVDSEDYEDRKNLHKHFNKEIVIHTGHNSEVRFYVLLHEVGHMLIHKRHKAYMQTSIGYGQAYFSPRSMTKKVAETEEEYEAWKLGYELARKMNLKINRKKYEKLKASFISTYLMRSVGRKIKNLHGKQKEKILVSVSSSSSSAFNAGGENKRKKKV